MGKSKSFYFGQKSKEIFELEWKLKGREMDVSFASSSTIWDIACIICCLSERLRKGPGQLIINQLTHKIEIGTGAGKF